MTTTQIYSHVAIAKLQAVHTLTHPARLERQPGQTTAVDCPSPAPGQIDATAVLLEALAGDSDEGEALDT